MHTTFENELNKIFGNDDLLKNTKYIGRVCFGELDGDMRLRAEFITLGVSSHYEALKLSAINRKDGVVDSVVVRFSELWGKKQTQNPNFPDGIYPHLWLSDNKLGWYVYQPSKSDFDLLKNSVKNYMSIYITNDIAIEKPSIRKQLADNKAKTDKAPKQAKSKNTELEV